MCLYEIKKEKGIVFDTDSFVNCYSKGGNVCLFYFHYERIVKMVVTQLQLQYARHYMVSVAMYKVQMLLVIKVDFFET